MFCRSCGNKLADNAKFCNLCGSPVAAPNTAPAETAPQAQQPAAPEKPVSQPMTAPLLRRPPQQSQSPVQPQQPYGQPNFQPTFSEAQVPPPMPAPTPAAVTVKQNRTVTTVLGLISAAVCIFLICSVFFKCYDTVLSGKFGTYSYLDRVAEVGKFYDKNVITYSIEGIKHDLSSAVLLITMWLQVVLNAAAAILIIVGVIFAFGRSETSEVKMWGMLKTAAICCFLGCLFCTAGVMFASINSNIENKAPAFKNWTTTPNFFAYFFIGLSLVTVIVCSVLKSRSVNTLAKIQANRNMSYHQFRY